MGRRYTIRNLLRALRNPSLFSEELANRLDSIEQSVRVLGGGHSVLDRRPSPPWIESPDAVCTLEQNGLAEQRAAMSALDADRVVVSPEHPQSVVESDLVGLEDCEEVTVTAAFDSDTETVRETYRFVNDEAFDVDRIPFRLESSTPADRITISLDMDEDRARGSGPFLTVPFRPHSRGRDVPIFLLSVDTFHYSYLETFAEEIDRADEFVYPAEPRTQGYATPQSHATMLTGVHPGDHGYQGIGVPGCNPIAEDLTLLPEFLMERGYRCLGLTSVNHLDPKWGFSRGFHRYEVAPMTKSGWLQHGNDARDQVDTLESWLDRAGETERLFAFLHVFDPHSPYIPPLTHETGSLDLTVPQRTPADVDYFEADRSNPHVSSDVARKLESHYGAAIQYVGSQIDRLLGTIEERGLFDDSLIVITGDHGAEFYERGRSPRKTLYDDNVRPGMMVKPPSGVDLPVPDTADTLDFFPTIAELLAAPVPNQCQGRAWQAGRESPLRIVERIHPEWYNVSVERDGIKGIFTYEENNPNRPTDAQVRGGPVFEEFYRIEDVRNRSFDDVAAELATETKSELREVAERFVRQGQAATDRTAGSQRVDSRTRRRLENLGYK